MEKQIDTDELKDIATDLEAIEIMLMDLEASQYFIGGNECLTFRAIKGSVRYTRDKLERLIKSKEATEQNKE